MLQTKVINVLILFLFSMVMYSNAPNTYGDNCNEAKRYFNEALNIENKPKKEITLYKEAIELCPDYKEAHYNLGIIYKAQGKYDLAVNEYNEVIRIDPGFVKARNNLGIVYKIQGKYDDAIKEYEEAIKINKDLAFVNFNLGLVYKAKNLYEKEIEVYRDAIKINPDITMAHLGMSIAFANTNNLLEAIYELMRYKELELSPEKINIAESWIEIFKEKLDHQKNAPSERGTVIPLPFNGDNDIVIKDWSGKPVRLYNESHALLIGVSDYVAGWPTLSFVEDDIKEVKTILERHGFNVILVEDPDRKQLYQAFDDFIVKYGLDEQNRLLFYYAGHGHTIKHSYGEMEGYIVPVDAVDPSIDQNGFLARAMDMQQISVFARRIQSKHALFLFDSCFSGSIFSLSRGVPENISYKASLHVRQFITSGSADEKVPDKSLFREQFVYALEGEGDSNGDGYLTGMELGEFLQDRVINYSDGAQHPQYGKMRDPNLDKGDFVFKVFE